MSLSNKSPSPASTTSSTNRSVMRQKAVQLLESQYHQPHPPQHVDGDANQVLSTSRSRAISPESLLKRDARILALLESSSSLTITGAEEVGPAQEEISGCRGSSNNTNYNSSSYTTVTDGDGDNVQVATDDSSASPTVEVDANQVTERPNQTKTSPDALLVLEDFWVRTKAPLNYNMILLHQIMYKDLAGASSETISALAKPIRCFRTKVKSSNSRNFDHQDHTDCEHDHASSGTEGFLQCMTVLDVSTSTHKNLDSCGQDSKRFSLFLSTGDWLMGEEAWLDIKFFKEGNPHHFAESTLPLSELMEYNYHGHNEDQPRQFEIIDKTAITSIRRRIRIGSLKFKLLFSNMPEIKRFAEKLKKSRRVLRTPSPRPSTTSNSNRSSTMRVDASLKIAGLVVTSSQDKQLEDDYDSSNTVNNDDSALLKYPEPEPDFEFYDIPDQKSDINSDRDNNNLTIEELKSSMHKDKLPIVNSSSYSAVVHHDIVEKVIKLTGQVSTISSQLQQTECELNELREEVTSLRAEKCRNLQIIENCCEKIDSLKLALSLSETTEKEVEYYKEQVATLQQTKDDMERMTRIVHTLTADPLPPPPQLLENLEAVINSNL